MRKKTLLPLSFFLFLSLQLFAQKDTFQIKDYKYRTKGYSGLTLNFELSGGVNKYHDVGNNKISNQMLNIGPVGLQYFHTYSTDKKTNNTLITVNAGGYTGSSSFNGVKATQSAWAGSGSWSTDSRFFTKGNWFFEIGSNLLFNANRGKGTIDNAGNKQTNASLNEQLVAGFGKGRMERVQDAQMALFILNDLKKQGLITSEITNKMGLAFARLITDINNNRVFDFRKKRIYELTTMDSFLKSSGMVTVTDIRHFITINDNWTLALNPFRQSGWNWFVRLKPQAQYDYNNNNNNEAGGLQKTEYTSKQFMYFFTPEVGYEKQIPVSLKWQHGFGTSITFGTGRQHFKSNEWINNINSKKTDSTIERMDLGLHAFYNLGYYPNNRTAITTNFIFDATRLKQNDPPFEKITVNYQPQLYVNAQYFISYSTYLNAYLTVGYNSLTDGQNNQLATKNFYTNFGAKLSHIIF